MLAVLSLAVVVPASSGVASAGGPALPAGLEPAAPEGDGQIIVVPGDQDGRGRPQVGIGGSVRGPVARRGAAVAGSRSPRCRWLPTPELETSLPRPAAERTEGGRGGRPGPLARLFGQVCDGVTVGYSWFGPGVGAAAGARVPSPTADQLAREAYARLLLPLPAPRQSPDLSLADGRRAVLVGEHTWLWTVLSRFRPQTRRVQAGAVWAQVTATPIGLTFDPGTGAAPISCAGPGTPFAPGRYAPHTASPTCDYQYSKSSAGLAGGVVAAEYGITWRVRWTGAAGATPGAGQLPDMTSRARTRFAVAEAQALGVAD